MEKLAHEIWIFNGESVQFLGLPFSTRMWESNKVSYPGSLNAMIFGLQMCG